MNALVGFNTCLPGLRLYYAVFTRWPLLHAARDLPTLIPCQCEEIFIFEISNTPKRDLQYHSVTPKTSFRRGNMFGHLRLDQVSNIISINTPLAENSPTVMRNIPMSQTRTTLQADPRIRLREEVELRLRGKKAQRDSRQ